MSPAVVRADGTGIEEGLERLLALLGGLSELVKPGADVFIKPNIVAPFAHAATDLRILAALVRSVRRCGGRPVIGESAGFEFDTAATFRVYGLERLAAELQVPLLNLDTVAYKPCLVPGFGTLPLPEPALSADVFINVPKLKLHSLTGVTLGVKNLMGLLPREARRQVHVRGLERGIEALASAVPVGLTITDALTVTPRAAFAVPRPVGLLIAGWDMREVDRACGYLLGAPASGDVSWVCEPGERPPAPLGELSGAEGRLYRWVFWALYAADIAFAALSRGRSLIPYVHHLAVRPRLIASRCDGCGACQEACAMDAIDLNKRRIIASRCMRLRCLFCITACPSRAIVLSGWRRPKEL